MKINFRLFSIMACLSVSLGVQAQEEEQSTVNQEVKVVKPYEPVISDAFKISNLPKINDTIKVEPSFSYSITPRKYNTTFKPQMIQAARLVKEPLNKLYYAYLKAGFGSYLSPLFEAHVGSKRQENYQWGASFLHHSSHGKVKNTDGSRVYAGFSRTDLNANGKYFLANDQLVALDLDYQNRKNYYYGYNTDLVTDINPAPLNKAEIEPQNAHNFKVQANWQTYYLDSADVNFDLETSFRSFTALNGVGEQAFKLNGKLNYFFETEFLGVDMGLTSYKSSGYADSSLSLVMNFNPWIGAFGDKWQIVAGVKTFYDGSNQKYGFYPRLSMHYNVIDFFLIPYFELGGVYNENNYKDIFYENPYVRQDLGVLPTENNLDLSLGFRGNISSRIAFNLKANYSNFRNQYFFVNDTTQAFDQKFTVVYDDVNRFRLLGEIAFKTTKDLSFRLKGNYYRYELNKEMYAWHKPEYEGSLDVRYVIQDKIVLDLNLFAIGSRYAKTFASDGTVVAKSLDGIFDANLGVEYRLSKIISGFVRFNNIANQRYIQWNNYPTQRFNFMAGLTYSL